MVLLETIPVLLASELTCWKWRLSLALPDPGITADMLEIVLDPPRTKEKVLKTVPATTSKKNMPETVYGLPGVIQDMPETFHPPPPPPSQGQYGYRC